MNNRVTLVLAGALLVGAIIAGYAGLVLSRPPAPVAGSKPPVPPGVADRTVASVEDQTRQPVVVLLHDALPFVPLKAEDLVLEKLRAVPAGSFTSIDQAVGRMPWRKLTTGSWLSEESFEAGGTLARMIHPNERALAMAVDEVSGAAGQLTPGDYVDVLLFLRQDASNPQQSAQVVVPALRVLSVGEQLGLTNDGKPASPAQSAEDRAKQEQRRASARTVVLAVPEQLLSQLMLASQAGVLRLAVRSADEGLLASYWEGESDAASNWMVANRNLYRFTQLAFAALPKTTPSVSSSPRPHGIEVIRGNQFTQRTP